MGCNDSLIDSARKQKLESQKERIGGCWESWAARFGICGTMGRKNRKRNRKGNKRSGKKLILNLASASIEDVGRNLGRRMRTKGLQRHKWFYLHVLSSDWPVSSLMHVQLEIEYRRSFGAPRLARGSERFPMRR